MGADWRQLTWLEYQMTLTGWNALPQHNDGKPADFEPSDRLRRAMEHHSVH